MDFNIEVRKKQLENLNQFICSSKDRVESLLEFIGWSSEKILNEPKREMVKCSINSEHRVLASTLSKHLSKCVDRKEGYNSDDEMLSEPICTQGSTVLIDHATKLKILTDAVLKNPNMKTCWRSQESIPKTADRYMSMFSPDERSVLYDYAISSTSGPSQPPEFNLSDDRDKETKNLTLEEIKARERDAKRRRIKYKAKSIHINNKNPTEILRELIGGQMELYQDWVKQTQNITNNEEIMPEEEIISLVRNGKQMVEQNKNSRSREQSKSPKRRSKSPENYYKNTQFRQYKNELQNSREQSRRSMDRERNHSRNKEFRQSREREEFKFRQYKNEKYSKNKYERFKEDYHRSRSSSQNRNYDKYHSDFRKSNRERHSHHSKYQQ